MRGSLLQSQVPGVGAAVRVWRSDRAPATDPLVIEAIDPSATPNAVAPGLDTYVD